MKSSEERKMCYPKKLTSELWLIDKVTKENKGHDFKTLQEINFMDILDDNLFQVISLFELDVKDNSTRTQPREKIHITQRQCSV